MIVVAHVCSASHLSVCFVEVVGDACGSGICHSLPDCQAVKCQLCGICLLSTVQWLSVR